MDDRDQLGPLVHQFVERRQVEAAVLDPHVKVYPFKTIEAGAAIHSNLIWESRGITTLFGRDEVSGLVNVDITPDVASRIGMAYGTTLARDARIVVSRDANPAARRMIPWADIGTPIRVDGRSVGRRAAPRRRAIEQQRGPDREPPGCRPGLGGHRLHGGAQQHREVP